ncbi:MAG: hypothetical protein K2O36_06170 [Ruminococcus sp.]|nr:hypothetical protein [Ruminococcus sp.]
MLISIPDYVAFGYYDKNGNLKNSPEEKISFTDISVKEYFEILIETSKKSTEWLAVRYPMSVPQAVLMSQNKENLHMI